MHCFECGADSPHDSIICPKCGNEYKVEDKYFNNLQRIEEKWKELRSNNFEPKLKDDFWRLCMEGKELFWMVHNAYIKTGLSFRPKSVPAYERTVMFLEHEKKYRDALRNCEEANKFKIDTNWYNKRIVKLSKLIK